MTGKDWNLNIKRTALTFFLGVLWIGDAVVLSASICRSFFKGPLALALGMHGCEATEVTYIIA